MYYVRISAEGHNLATARTIYILLQVRIMTCFPSIPFFVLNSKEFEFMSCLYQGPLKNARMGEVAGSSFDHSFSVILNLFSISFLVRFWNLWKASPSKTCVKLYGKSSAMWVLELFSAIQPTFFIRSIVLKEWMPTVVNQLVWNTLITRS